MHNLMLNQKRGEKHNGGKMDENGYTAEWRQCAAPELYLYADHTKLQQQRWCPGGIMFAGGAIKVLVFI